VSARRGEYSSVLTAERRAAGRIDAQDLKLLGVASNIVTAPFRIKGDPAQP